MKTPKRVAEIFDWELLAWMLGITQKQLNKLRISEIYAAWAEANLPPLQVVARFNNGEHDDMVLLDLGRNYVSPLRHKIKQKRAK